MTVQEFKDARLTLGMNQQEFAVALGYKTFVAISRKENGSQPISASDEIIITHLLNNIKKPPTNAKRHKVQ